MQSKREGSYIERERESEKGQMNKYSCLVADGGIVEPGVMLTLEVRGVLPSPFL